MPKRASTAWRSFVAGGAWLLAAGWLAAPPVLRAHDLFTAYLQHRVAVTLGAKHVDVTVQLTFFEDGSEHERARMDANRDGRLSRAEIEACLRELEPRLAHAVGLRVGGRAVALTPLYAPALDLLGNDRVGRGHHRLTVYYFAPTPAGLAPGVELVVEDRLWPGARALGMIQVEGRDGCRLEAIPPGDPVWPPAREGEAREFKARLLAPPKVKVASPVSTFSPSATACGAGVTHQNRSDSVEPGSAPGAVRPPRADRRGRRSGHAGARVLPILDGIGRAETTSRKSAGQAAGIPGLSPACLSRKPHANPVSPLP